MGCVWSAYNVQLESPVAIKVLRAGVRNPKLAERLRLEARSVARLVHPSIVRVLDIAAMDNGDPFIVMELLTGENMARLLGRGRLRGARAVQLMLPIAEALALAHAKGIVHRDLKPENVFISADGEQLQPKLLDFGIAKLVYGSARAKKLTTSGTLLGSPNYMSPEQARGDEVDHRSDIWSFCVVLYEAVTGVAAFSGRDKRALLRAVMDDEPAPLAVEADVDMQLARLLRWGLSKDRAQRPTSIRELGRQLAQWLLAQGVSDDASGAPLAAKWQAHIAEPSMRQPPPISMALESAQHVPVRTLVSQREPEPHAEGAEATEARPSARIGLTRRRGWTLAVSISIVSAGVAWLTSAGEPDLRSAMDDPIADHAPPAAPKLQASAPQPVLAGLPAAPARASVQPVHHLSETASTLQPTQLRAAPPAVLPKPTARAPRVAPPKGSASTHRPASVAAPVRDAAFELIQAY
jgi:serine/threonine-protein kinase